MAEDRDEQTKQALITSLRLLAASPKSRRELEKKLRSKGYPPGAIEAALSELSGQGVLDDNAYAKNLIGLLIHGKSAGRHKIAFELKRRGVSEALRKDLLGSLSESDERERALEIARLKWQQSPGLDPRKRKKKVFDHLMRKGYDFQTVQDVLEAVIKKVPDGGLE